MFYIIDCRFTENEMYAKTNKWQIQKLMHFDSHFINQLSSNFTSRQKTTKKYRVMIEEPVNYKYMYVFSPGDSIACIMKDAVCKFYKEKFQIKKYRESALATYSILLFWNHVTKTLTVVEQRKFPKIFTFEVFETLCISYGFVKRTYISSYIQKTINCFTQQGDIQYAKSWE